MLTSLWLIIGIGLLVGFWLDGARAREMATSLAGSLCQRHGVQFLDQTVELKRLGVRWGSNGLRFRRMFAFDFSLEGMGRRRGYVILIGTQMELFQLDLPEDTVENKGSSITETDSASAAKPVQPGDKVVPFRRPPKR